MLELLLFPIFLSLLVAGFFLSFRLWVASPFGLRLSFLAIPVGLIVGLSFISGAIKYPPEEGFQWIYIMALIGGVWPFLYLSGEVFSLKTAIMRFLVIFFGIYFMIKTWSSFDLRALFFWGFMSVLVSSFWFYCEKIVLSRLFPFSAFITSVSLSVFFLFLGSLRLSQMMGVFTALLGLASFWNLRFFYYPIGLNLIPFVVMVFTAFLVSHGALVENPFQVVFIFSPFWVSFIYRFFFKDSRLLAQYLILFIFSFPFLFSVLYRLFKTY